ncbi:MAG TPA: Ig-like domain-containing protein, partial [Humisphaera sp.]|nr:Ig-like domain-containing protein [Humisphaera sp.]
DIEDAGGNIIAPSDPQFNNVTLSLVGAPAGVTLGGTTTVTEQNGVATFSDISIALPGTYMLTASDQSLASATSFSVTIVAPPKLIPNVGLGSSNIEVAQYQSVTLTASVGFAIEDGAFVVGAVPTGTVSFYDGQTLLYTGAVDASGTLQFVTSTLQPGAHSITASYSGDGAYAAGTSTALTQTIDPIAADSPLLVPTISKAKIPASIVEGTPIKAPLPIVVANHGGGLSTAAFTITVYASPIQTLDPSAVQFLTVSHSVKLKPGASKTIPVKLGALPTTLPNGAYYLLVKVVDQAGSTTITATNSAMQIAAPFVSLSASVGAITPGNIPVGKKGAVTVTISNSGNVIAAGGAMISLGLTSDGMAVASSLLSLTKNVKIKPGATLTLHLRFTRTASQVAGTYFPSVSIGLGGQEASAIGNVTLMLT